VVTPDSGPFRSPAFVDASAWLAATNQRDQNHAVARRLLDACVQLVTSTWTAYEALSMLKSRAGPDLVAELWSLLLDQESVAFIYVTKEIEERALDLFFRYRDKSWGIVDCANLVVMEDTGCRQAIGFDHHFVEASRQRGFEVLPGDS
jgi:predicted nucleic acid-binding protein